MWVISVTWGRDEGAGDFVSEYSIYLVWKRNKSGLYIHEWWKIHGKRLRIKYWRMSYDWELLSCRGKRLPCKLNNSNMGWGNQLVGLLFYREDWAFSWGWTGWGWPSGFVILWLPIATLVHLTLDNYLHLLRSHIDSLLRLFLSLMLFDYVSLRVKS